MARKEINFLKGSKLNFHTNGTENEINWLKKESITIKKYTSWRDELKNNTILSNSDLIISDNHILPAMVFPNTKLMGSFLWHDVNVILNDDTAKISMEEHNFIDKVRPDMLCLAGMAMPEVLNFTNPIQLPWYCEKYSGAKGSEKYQNILVTGGGTELMNETLLKLVLIISELDRGLRIQLDSKLDNVIGNRRTENISKFSFTDEDFSSLTAIICRPGIGILTDCVRYDVPAFVINDGYNGEINCNASNVEKLGIGKSYNTQIPLECIALEFIKFIYSSDQLELFRNNLKSQKTNGADFAAKYLINSIL